MQGATDTLVESGGDVQCDLTPAVYMRRELRAVAIFIGDDSYTAVPPMFGATD
jgi:hypothetical protein